MKSATALVLVVTALAFGASAEAAISSVFGGSVPCTVQTGTNAGERHCSGIFTTFDGAPIDVNVGFPAAPATGPDGNFPIVGVFHGWGGTKFAPTDGAMQEWLDAGYAVFSMSDRGWGNSCGATDPKKPTPRARTATTISWTRATRCATRRRRSRRSRTSRPTARPRARA